MKRHALTRHLERALAAKSSRSADVAALVERRLRALEDVAAGRPLHPRRREALRPSPLVRRELRRFEGSWHDGDSNAVRDRVGNWGEGSPGTDPALARRYVAAGDDLVAARAPDTTLLCLLFELEAALE